VAKTEIYANKLTMLGSGEQWNREVSSSIGITSGGHGTAFQWPWPWLARILLQQKFLQVLAVFCSKSFCGAGTQWGYFKSAQCQRYFEGRTTPTRL
jgi:hypothetical protein